MPRQARLDAPGLLHHVIARGLNRGAVFQNKGDYVDFLFRIESSLEKAPNQILAWALMPNHFHLLIRSGTGGLPSFMRRLMSGYAVAFNARHKRSGYLFQNRYKSIVCDQESYLLELIRYIHLNPIRAGIVNSVQALRQFPYSGHAVLMNVIRHPWQETSEILARFGTRARYEQFIIEGQGQGRRQDLTGGGLMRSTGAATSPLQDHSERERQSFDARVLGNGDFVEEVFRRLEVVQNEKTVLRQKGINLQNAARRLAEEADLPEHQLFNRGRTSAISRAKSILIYIGVKYFGKTTKDMATLTKMSLAAACKSRERGEAFFNTSVIRRWLVS